MNVNYLEIVNSIKRKTSDIETILSSIARYIEENNNITEELNYWDNEVNMFSYHERVFYKVWSWLSYIELESFIKPVQEYRVVFGEKKEKLILNSLELSDEKKSQITEELLLKNGTGKKLLDWFELSVAQQNTINETK